MRSYCVTEKPFRVFGIPHFETRRSFFRLPDDLREKVPTLAEIGKRSCGGRIGFRTDSRQIGVRMTFEPLTVNPNISLHADNAAFLFVGDHKTARYAGAFNPPKYGLTEFEKTVNKGADGMEDILILLPRGTFLRSVEILLEDGAKIEPPTPYTYGPVVFYGSSIVECSCPASGYNSYVQMVSRFLDCDYYNLGFSGNARAELPLADYILTLPMQAFVFDYDYNAKDAAFLEETHERFFLRIREAKPDLPVLFMTKPDFDYDKANNAARRNVVRKTYENALARGDKNVWFIDGETLFGDEDRELCTVDRIHPNDLGFYRMAKRVAPVLQEMLL